MKFNKSLIVVALLLLSVVYVQAQRRNNPNTQNAQISQITTQIATTEDGRRVELSSDGRWRYLNDSSESAPKPLIQEINGIEYKLQKCQFSAPKRVICDIQITNNRNEDVKADFGSNTHSYHDNLGNEVKGVESVKLGNVNEYITLISGVPVKAKITFAAADASAIRIARLHIHPYVNNNSTTTVEFRNIPLQK